LDTPTPKAPKAPVDLEGFRREIEELRRELRDSLGPEDLAHLRKIERWGRTATALGLATAWMGPNPISIGGLALGRSTRWIVMHHIGHRGYDRVPGVPKNRTSKVFAMGRRRALDWLDWIVPDAWNYEHNILHHSFTGELDDPDLVERNSAWVREHPMWVRYAFFGFLTLTWRESYYSKNTLQTWMARKGEKFTEKEIWREVIRRSFLLYPAVQFGLLPLLFAPLGPLAVGSAFVNSVLADFVTNAHTFLVVGPNHSGDDVYRFADRPKDKAEWYLRQIIGSVNFNTGGDLRDYAHLFLNYQIEHHLFPDIPMRQCQAAQPRVKAICEKHGIPYLQESVFKRYAQLAAVIVGKKKMPYASDEVLGREPEASEISDWAAE